MRARLVHDVLRVVFPRVGLRRRLYEQGRKPETNEGLPQRCDGPPSAAPEVAHSIAAVAAFSSKWAT